MNPLFRIDFSISDSLKIVRKSVLIYETIIYYYEGYKCNEIGNILRITESAVKKRLERGRKLLKQELKED